MSKSFRIFLTTIISLAISIVWCLAIVWDANRSGGDNGFDPFGMAHLIFMAISAPILFYFSSKYIYRVMSKNK